MFVGHEGEKVAEEIHRSQRAWDRALLLTAQRHVVVLHRIGQKTHLLRCVWQKVSESE